jgi:hypothetical protein
VESLISVVHLLKQSNGKVVFRLEPILIPNWQKLGQQKAALIENI